MRTAILGGLLTAFLGIAIFFQSRVPEIVSKKEFLRPPEKIKYFTLGYNDFLVSSLWLRVVQNLDYCENGRLTDDEAVAPELTEDRIDGVLNRKLRASKCHLGWVYSMLDLITEIDPRYYLAYETGATFLSVTVDDREGARRIFEKGAKNFPQDWLIAFRAGYHYMWEMQDPQRSAELFALATQHGAPEWIVALSAGLYTKAGQAKLAKAMLEDALQKKPDSRYVERIKLRLSAVNKILQENP